MLKNGVEAIHALREANVVVIDADADAMTTVEEHFAGRVEIIRDPYDLSQYHVAKIAFVDNGIGMTEAEMRKYFSTLFVQAGDGQQSDVISLVGSPDEHLLKPELIGQHGTCIVLLGNALEHDTTLKPNEQYTHAGYWFHQAVNNFFYRTPGDVKIVACVHEIDGKVIARTLYGHEPFFMKYDVASGSHEMSTAFVHWIVFDETKADSIHKRGMALYQACSGYRKFGHVAVVHDNKLFDLEVRDDAIPSLQRFGVIAGHNNVVVYIEPKSQLGLTMNLVRTALVSSNGDPLPWSEWAREFYETMPDELRNYVESKVQSGGKNDRDYLVEQIAKHLDLLSIKGKSVASRLESSVESVRGRETRADRPKTPRFQRDPASTSPR